MSLKKIVLAFFAILVFFALSAASVTIVMNDAERVEGNLVGKVGDNIFVISHDAPFVIDRDVVYQIINNDRNVKEGVFARADWMDPIYVTSPFVPFTTGRVRDESQSEPLTFELQHVPPLRDDEWIYHELHDPFWIIPQDMDDEVTVHDPPTQKDMTIAWIAGFLSLIIMIAAIIFYY